MICRDLDIDKAIASRQRQRALIEGRGPRVSDFIINSYAGAAGGDPYFSSVIQLMHFDNTLLDSSPIAATFTAGGSAAVSTSSPIVGTGSLLLDGSGDYIAANDDAAYALGTADWTFEYKFRPDAVSPQAYDTVWTQSSNTSNVVKFDFGPGGTRPRFVVVSGGSVVAEYLVTTPLSFNPTVDYSACWVRNGTSILYFHNGVNVGLTNSTSIGSGSLPDLSSSLVMGYDPLNAGRDFRGRFDEVRFTKGVARYVSNYTPITVPFPDF